MRVRATLSLLAFVVAVFGAAWLLVEVRVSRLESELDDRVAQELRKSAPTSSSVASVVDARVDARMQQYSEALNDAMGIETTSPVGTFWWLGDRVSSMSDAQDRVFTSLEDVFTADRELGRRFLRVHKAIDNKPYSFPYEDSDLAEPYLTYDE